MTQTPIPEFFEIDLFPDSLRQLPLHSDEWGIAAACIAYAAGDAFGVAHEFVTPPESKVSSTLLGKKDWPYGGVSDDTTLSLLTIESIRAVSPEGAATRYLQLLRNAQPTLRGLGPTTRAALGMHVSPEERHFIGKSNGGMMRPALLGALFNPSRSIERKAWVKASVSATHSNPKAIEAALLLSESFSDAIAHGDHNEVPVPPADWNPPGQGITLDPLESYYGVLYVVSRSESVESAYLQACQLGGDTDTIAALSGALIALRMRERSGLFDIPWLMDVRWSEIPQLKSGLELMFSRRREWAR